MSIIQDGPYDSKTLTKVFAVTSGALLLSVLWMVQADHQREWKDYQELFRALEIEKRSADVTAERVRLDSYFAVTLKGQKEPLKTACVKSAAGYQATVDGKTSTYPEGQVEVATPWPDHLATMIEAANKSVASEQTELDKYGEILASQLAEYQSWDIRYKNAKSKRESYVFYYEHALQLGESSVAEKKSKLDKEQQKEDSAQAQLQRLKSEQPHGALTAFAGASSVVMTAPFESFDGSKLTIIGFPPIACPTEQRAATEAFCAKLGRDQVLAVGVDGDGQAASLEAPILGTDGLEWYLSVLRSSYTAAQKKLEGFTATLARLETSLAKVDRSAFNDWFRNRPLVDFIRPSLKIKQLVVEGIRDDYSFAQIRKVDRCETCHLAIDKAGYSGALIEIKGQGMVAVQNIATVEGNQSIKELTYHDGRVERRNASELGAEEALEQPFTAHPRLDLFLTDLSPHPKAKFGCTICHKGEGRSADFHFAAHTPADADQQHEWEEEHHWKPRHHWDHPQKQKAFLEASCLLCHDNNRPVEGAPTLNFGREVWERSSCFGCHKMKGYTNLPKRGPDLRRLKDKLKEPWVYAWLENPMKFRPKTTMPRFWGINENMTDEAEIKQQKAYDSAEIYAVTKYLFAQSGGFDTGTAAAGDAAAGERLLNEKGCLGCHSMEDQQATAKAPRGYTPDEYGPNLSNIGSKVGVDWLRSWLKNPRHYWADTRMPDLQLTDVEARDMAAFLATKTSAPTSEMPKPGAKEVVELCKNYLAKDNSPEQVVAMLSGKAGANVSFPEMAKGLDLSKAEDQMLYLGRNTLTRYGCFGCHLIDGMETRPGIGAELTAVGDKALDKIDFGQTDLSHKPGAREEWIQYKVKNPRYADKGKVRSLGYLDRSRMPRFKLSDAEREALTVWVSGHSEKEIAAEYRYNPPVRKAQALEGAYQIQQKNCKACHVFEVDTVTLTRRIAPAEVDDELEVQGKTVEGWTELLQDGEQPAPERTAAAKALASAGAWEPLRETLADLDPEDDELSDKDLKGPLTALMTGVPTETDKVKGLVTMDNRGGKYHGAALVQLYEDGAGKLAGEMLTVSDDPAAEFDLYFSDLSVTPTAVGAESVIPAALRAAHPGDFLTAAQQGEAQWTRYRGGRSVAQAKWPRAIAKLGEDPRVLEDNFDLDTVPSLLEALDEAKSYAAPHLRNEGSKVQTPWLKNFLVDPSVKIRPWLIMRMPNYGLSELEAQSIASYFATAEEEATIARATDSLGRLQSEVKADKKAWPRQTILTALDQRLTAGAADYFDLTIGDGVLNSRVRGDVSLSADVPEKTDAYRAERQGEDPYWYSRGYEMFISSQCLSCHLWEGRKPGKDDPSAWGPDLHRVRERIRPEWFSEWVHNPASIVPGTKMSKQFGPGKYREVLDKPIEDQIDCLKDFVFGGLKPGLECFPKELAAGGGELRLTSGLLSLDGLDAVYVTTPSGEQREYSVANGLLSKELSEGRAIALKLSLSGAAGSYRITTSKVGESRQAKSGDLMFDAAATVTVK